MLSLFLKFILLTPIPLTPAKTVEKPSGSMLGIIVSGVLLIGLNVGSFLLYQLSHCGEAFVMQLWTYLSSDIFKVITVSLSFPMILLFLDRKFKFGESARKSLEERIEKNRLERKAKREEAILQTIKWWNELFVLAAAISRFKESQLNQTAEDLVVKAICIASTGEDIVNMWSHRFPELSDNDRETFIVFLNALIHSSHTVACTLTNRTVPASEKEHLQNCLVVILDGIKGIAHHKIVNVLNCTTNLDDPEPQHANDEKWRSDLQLRVQLELAFLKKWAKPIIALGANENGLRDDIKTDTSRKLDAISTEFQDWIMKNQPKSLSLFPKFNELQKVFEEIPSVDRVRVQSSPYSTRYVIDLASLAGFQNLQNDIISRANLKSSW